VIIVNPDGRFDTSAAREMLCYRIAPPFSAALNLSRTTEDTGQFNSSVMPLYTVHDMRTLLLQ